MAFTVMGEGNITRCTNPKCKGSFTVSVYTFSDLACTVISDCKLIPLTGNTPYYCPCCGKNLGKKTK